jgi:hypothetical protein
MTDTLRPKKKLLLEVMYKADYCLLCYYMDEAICEIMPNYEDVAEYRRVEFLKGDGKKRFLELSVSLFGEDGVYKHRRIAPVPSLFIEGELVFDAIPPRYELEEAIQEALLEHGMCSTKDVSHDDAAPGNTA